jgi:hypothetical protein
MVEAQQHAPDRIVDKCWVAQMPAGVDVKKAAIAN